MIYVIAESYVVYRNWCEIDNDPPLRHSNYSEVTPLISRSQVRGRNWQDGDRVVIVGEPADVPYWHAVLVSCGMPPETF